MNAFAYRSALCRLEDNLMLPKVVKHKGAHELFMNTYGRRRRRSTVLLASERSERAQSCSCSIEISDTYVYIYIYMYIYMWPYVKLYAHAWCYVMWEGLSVNHFLKRSNHFK